jgi:hypothetical protein
METVRFSETLASTNQSTRRLNPKEHHQSNVASFEINPVAETNSWQETVEN